MGDIEHGRRLIEQAFPGAAVAAYRRTLIKECAAGAVVGRLYTHAGWPAHIGPDPGPIPIANGPPGDERLREVAGELLVMPWEVETADDAWPFAAAYHDAGGVRTYVLVSGECKPCAGCGYWGDNRGSDRCADCNGTGTTTDVGSIARRYGGDGDARTARFEVKL